MPSPFLSPLPPKSVECDNFKLSEQRVLVQIQCLLFHPLSFKSHYRHLIQQLFKIYHTICVSLLISVSLRQWNRTAQKLSTFLQSFICVEDQQWQQQIHILQGFEVTNTFRRTFSYVSLQGTWSPARKRFWFIPDVYAQYQIKQPFILIQRISAFLKLALWFIVDIKH